jgi:hypothetical protein
MSDCIELFKSIINITEKINDEFILKVTENNYETVCSFNPITFDSYFRQIKEGWEKILNDFIKKSKETKKCQDMIHNDKKTTIDIISDFTKSNVLTVNKVIIKPKFNDTIVEIAKVFGSYCRCDTKYLFGEYFDKYKDIIFDMILKNYGNNKKLLTTDNLKKYIETMYNKFKEFIDKFRDIHIGSSEELAYTKSVLNDIATKIGQLYNFSIDGELDRLIPDELGSMKQFFIRIISTYYNNIHPIIWCQIMVSILKNWFIELPFTPNETFAFLSKSILLNSGPFILKILQTIRPVLSEELKKKYKLEKLLYPLLTSHQEKILLERILINKDYRMIRRISASVGHVCIIEQNNIKYVVKFIKPISIIQSCWEYKTLINAFPNNEQNECNINFIKNMLISNGNEMNVNGEIDNLNNGFKYYKCSYNNVFGKNINMNLSTIVHVPNIIHHNWYSLVMSLAPGVPLSAFLEPVDVLKEDTIFRAMLHRGLDLLVYKFFYTIIDSGFYHGDLHAGNAFFSYKKSQITLIDFGAVGQINRFKDEYVEDIISVVLMLVFNDYDGILDKITEIANKKCPNVDKIDTSTQEYINFKNELLQYKITKIKNSNKDNKINELYKGYMFGTERINEEIEKYMKNYADDAEKHIYSIYNANDDIIYNQDKYRLTTSALKIELTDSKSSSDILKLILEFYVKLGVNLASKLNELFEFQKAYALLLGLLAQTHYDSSRIATIFEEIGNHKKSIIYNNFFSALKNSSKLMKIYKEYIKNKNLYNNFVSTYLN